MNNLLSRKDVKLLKKFLKSMEAKNVKIIKDNNSFYSFKESLYDRHSNKSLTGIIESLESKEPDKDKLKTELKQLSLEFAKYTAQFKNHSRKYGMHSNILNNMNKTTTEVLKSDYCVCDLIQVDSIDDIVNNYFKKK